MSTDLQSYKCSLQCQLDLDHLSRIHRCHSYQKTAGTDSHWYGFLELPSSWNSLHQSAPLQVPYAASSRCSGVHYQDCHNFRYRNSHNYHHHRRRYYAEYRLVSTSYRPDQRTQVLSCTPDYVQYPFRLNPIEPAPLVYND